MCSNYNKVCATNNIFFMNTETLSINYLWLCICNIYADVTYTCMFVFYGAYSMTMLLLHYYYHIIRLTY